VKFFAEWVKDAAGLQRVTHEVWRMKKLDLAKLQKAICRKVTCSISTLSAASVAKYQMFRCDPVPYSDFSVSAS
jgi:hypothetical protein